MRFPRSEERCGRGKARAQAESHLAATFNKPDLAIVDHFTYVICGDGCLQEGITSETSSLAGHLGLGKLICLYDDNKIQVARGLRDPRGALQIHSARASLSRPHQG